MIELKDTDTKATMRQKDGTYVEVGLKEANFSTIEEVLEVPGVICNLMPAALWNEQTAQMNFPIEFTIGKPHPQAYYYCTGEEWKTSATIKEEMIQAQEKLTEEYLRKKEEQRIIDDMGINPEKFRNLD